LTWGFEKLKVYPMATAKKKSSKVVKGLTTAALLALTVAQPEILPLTGLIIGAMYATGKGK
jgi:hypothetical protein